MKHWEFYLFIFASFIAGACAVVYAEGGMRMIFLIPFLIGTLIMDILKLHKKYDI